MKTPQFTLPDYGRDVEENVQKVLKESLEELGEKLTWGCVLACLYTLQNKPQALRSLQSDIELLLTKDEVWTVKVACSIMSMTNTYYSFVHLTHDEEYSKLSAKFRVSQKRDPRTDPLLYEYAASCVSTLNRCDYCIQVHVKHLQETQSSQQIQFIGRITAAIFSVKHVLGYME